MFEEGFKRYNSVTILKVFGKTESQDAYVNYKLPDEKMPKYAYIRPVNLKSYTTVNLDCNSVLSHDANCFKDSDAYLESVLEQFAIALTENLPVNLVIAVIKKGRNTEFVARAEFL
jgi:hypothetical protein